MQTWESATHRIQYIARPRSRYHVYVYEKATGSCVLSLTYEGWQEVYASHAVYALVDMSRAKTVTVTQPCAKSRQKRRSA